MAVRRKFAMILASTCLGGLFFVHSMIRSASPGFIQQHDNNVLLTNRTARSTLQWKPFTMKRDDVISATRLPSILCLILTSGKSPDKMDAVRETWGKRCDKRLFLYGGRGSTEVQHINDSLVIPIQEGRDHLTGKIRAGLTFAYHGLHNQFDWILKCDDDTYVIMENLRHLLSHSSPKEPGYLGFRMKLFVNQGYMSGGAGYVISSSALDHVINKGFKNDSCRQDGGDEDVEIGKCLAASGVKVIDSLDSKGRETFHADSLKHHLLKTQDSWLHGYAWNKNPVGRNCCSEFSSTFHYVTPDEMRIFEHLLYQTSVYSTENEPNGEQTGDELFASHSTVDRDK